MAKHKFLTADLAAKAVLISKGVPPNSFVGKILGWVIEYAANVMANAGLRTANIIAINFTSDQDKKKFDEQQDLALSPEYISKLTMEQRLEKSKKFRSTFRDLVTFRFVRKQ